VALFYHTRLTHSLHDLASFHAAWHLENRKLFIFTRCTLAHSVGYPLVDSSVFPWADTRSGDFCIPFYHYCTSLQLNLLSISVPILRGTTRDSPSLRSQAVRSFLLTSAFQIYQLHFSDSTRITLASLSRCANHDRPLLHVLVQTR
jgi:hypothetical protein